MLTTTAKPLSIQLMIIYLISSLLFLSSIDLHIHTHEAAVSADHGAAVSITSALNAADEIKVSPEGMLHAEHGSVSLLAVFISLVLIIVALIQRYIPRFMRGYFIASRPFYCSPSLRAPPQ